MATAIMTGVFGIIGTIIGGLISWWIQKERVSADLKIALDAIKTEHMAEQTALYYLNHKGYTDRSFEYLQKRLGGFEPDELRKILVRAGAVRYIRDNGTEWWRLLKRMAEVADRNRKQDLGLGNEDL